MTLILPYWFALLCLDVPGWANTNTCFLVTPGTPTVHAWPPEADFLWFLLGFLMRTCKTLISFKLQYSSKYASPCCFHSKDAKQEFERDSLLCYGHTTDLLQTRSKLKFHQHDTTLRFKTVILQVLLPIPIYPEVFNTIHYQQSEWKTFPFHYSVSSTLW